MKIAKDITELIGSTPILEIGDYPAKIYAKLESFNPCSSVKDRVALALIDSALERGEINPDSTLIEPTSGNTGIGLAMVAASKNIRLILTMPESMSVERRALLSLLGAELVLTPKEQGMKGAIEKANQLNSEISNSFVFNQFSNKVNPLIHYQTTGVEIINQLQEIEPHIFVAGIGTGGTISGAGKRLKEKYPNIQIFGIEPIESAVISGGTPAPHKLQGIGAGFIPENLDLSLIESTIKVRYDDAIRTLKDFASTKGVMIGVSSAAALFAAIELANNPKNKGKNIVVVLPDSAERYLSTLV